MKNDQRYEALRKQGMSKSRAAAISNSEGSPSRGGKSSGRSRKGGRHFGVSSVPGGPTEANLEQA